MPELLADELRLREARHLQALEGNPLDAAQEALFARMLREGWSHEDCRAHLRARVRVRQRAERPAAE